MRSRKSHRVSFKYLSAKWVSWENLISLGKGIKAIDLWYPSKLRYQGSRSCLQLCSLFEKERIQRRRVQGVQDSRVQVLYIVTSGSSLRNSGARGPSNPWILFFKSGTPTRSGRRREGRLPAWQIQWRLRRGPYPRLGIYPDKSPISSQPADGDIVPAFPPPIRISEIFLWKSLCRWGTLKVENGYWRNGPWR